jgi:CHRD domain
VVAFEPEGRWWLRMAASPWDVFVHDEQPSPTFVTNSDTRPGTDPLAGSPLDHRRSTKEVTMRRRVLFLAAALGTVALLALGAPAFGEGRPFATTLTGAAEVPGPGDADASGTAFIALNQGQGEVCFDLSWAGIDGTVTAAHIHVGAATVAGPVVVGLFAGSLAGTDSASGCISGVSQALIKAIRQDPGNYYVNVHSGVFPAGAIRGQLAK